MNTNKPRSNIFAKKILHQNIFQDYNSKQYKIGGLMIKSDWLSKKHPQEYKPYIRSSFQLTQLIQRYQNLQELQRTSQNPTDTFKMAQLKYKMQNFQLRQQSPRKQLKQSKFSNNQYELLLQKIGDFWGSTYIRKCLLKDNCLRVQSQKEKSKKVINLDNYVFQYQQKGIKKQYQQQQSKKFEWFQNKKIRLFIHSQNQRSFCLYGNDKDIKSIIKGLQIKGIQKTKFDFFSVLNKQYIQKIITLFGSHLRIYQHLLKEKKNSITNVSKFNTLFVKSPSNMSQSIITNNLHIPTYNQDKLSIGQLSPIHKKYKQQQFKNVKKQQNRSPTRSLLNDSSFRLKCRRSNINYDQLQNQTQVFYSPDYKVTDIDLQINQVGISQQQLNENKIKQSQQQQLDQIMRRPVARKNTLVTYTYFKQNNNSQIIFDNQLELQQQQQKQQKQDQKVKINEKQQKYKYQQKQKSIYMCIRYFQQFIPYIKNQITFQIIQLIPQFQTYSQNNSIITIINQSQNMKKKISFKQKIQLHRNKSTTTKYYNQNIYQINQQSQNFILLFNDQVQQFQYHFTLQNLKNIQYYQDSSILLYIKDKKSQKIKICGKLNIILSITPINIHHIQQKQQSNTISFLLQYLWSNNPNFQQKYSFIDKKKRHYLIKKQWNQMIMKKIINKAYKKSQYNNQFNKAIFFGLPRKIFQKIKKIIQSENKKNIDVKKLLQLSPHYISILQNQIADKKVYDIRVLISIRDLIKQIISMPKNYQFTQRIHQLVIFFRYKFLMNFVKQIFRKTQPLLLKAKSQKQITMILAQYFTIQYEIDEIFTKISAYFN